MQQSTSHILMIRPAAFGFNVETATSNAFQSETHQKNVQEQALSEFNKMVTQLMAAGINVTVIDDTPQPPIPDAIFPNNWFSTHHDGSVVLYPMLAPNRRLERRMDLLEQLRKTFEVNRLIDLRAEEQHGLFLEGTGSIVFDHKQKLAYACRSPRTHEHLFSELCEALGYSSITFNAFDENRQAIYHTNVLLAIGSTWAVCCLDAIPKGEEEKVVSSLSKNHDTLTLSRQQMLAFAGNMLELINDRNEKIIVLSQTAFESLSTTQVEKLKQHGQLLAISIPTIETIGGGSVRCMMAEVFLPRSE